jgi:hypothetical protein
MVRDQNALSGMNFRPHAKDILNQPLGDDTVRRSLRRDAAA